MELVQLIAHETGLLLEVVNHNVRSRQYVCAGHVSASLPVTTLITNNRPGTGPLDHEPRLRRPVYNHGRSGQPEGLYPPPYFGVSARLERNSIDPRPGNYSPWRS
jgi:hypothetical protein